MDIAREVTSNLKGAKIDISEVQGTVVVRISRA
jgi:hypothetical protein